MFFRKFSIILLSLFGFLFLGFLTTDDVNAWELTDPFFNPNQSFTLTRSYMEQAEGAPYIVNDEQLNNFTSSSYILSPTSSAIQTKSLFSFKLAGYELSGDDSAAHYHSAQVVFYFIANNSSYIDFDNVPIFASYVLWDGGSNVKHQMANCTLSYSQDVSVPYDVAVSIECPQVTYRGTGFEYTWVDLTVGDLSGNDESSNYFYRYRNGGGLKLSPNIGQYIISATDNASELALEQITVQNQTIINQNQQMIDDSQEYYDKTYDSIDNISNQTPSDIDGSENQKTTDLITALGSLVGAFTSIQPASDCNIQLDFPNYAGGSQNVNLCQYKEKAPQIVLIGSSVFLVVFALKYWYNMAIKIYRVIRSFIDGTDDTEGEE